MAKYVSFFVIAFLCSDAFGAPRKNSLQQEAGVKELIKQVDTVRKEVEQSIKKALPDSQEVTNTLINVSKTFASAVEKGAKDLSESADKNKDMINNVIQDVSKGLSDSVKYIKGLAGDDVATKSQEVKAALQSHLDNIFASGKKIEEAIKPHLNQAQEHLKTFANTFFKDLAAAGEQLKADIDKAIESQKV
ncbi:hypothetical protein RN001_010993 [Aquatica leii]|uniref:Apolipophorin-III n=1 Tax=Aquatica leii TaxID=1421715 RepID=A0AAN7P7D0_9COLE|nr:hypothetical protein RN001_010993 [Aquatica leii]